MLTYVVITKYELFICEINLEGCKLILADDNSAQECGVMLL